MYATLYSFSSTCTAGVYVTPLILLHMLAITLQILNWCCQNCDHCATWCSTCMLCYTCCATPFASHHLRHTICATLVFHGVLCCATRILLHSMLLGMTFFVIWCDMLRYSVARVLIPSATWHSMCCITCDSSYMCFCEYRHYFTDTIWHQCWSGSVFKSMSFIPFLCTRAKILFTTILIWIWVVFATNYRINISKPRFLWDALTLLAFDWNITFMYILSKSAEHSRNVSFSCTQGWIKAKTHLYD